MFRSLDRPQGAKLFLAKVILKHSQINSFMLTGCCGSMSCCVRVGSQQPTLTQHDMLPQHPVNIKELICECF